MLCHVVACANNRVIGKDNKLPWHFPADLKFFKKLTVGGTVIMGRKTFESIGKPLPGRANFILTREIKKKEAAYSDCHPERSEGSLCGDSSSSPQNDKISAGAGSGSKVFFFSSIEEALKNVKTSNAFVIGGATLYEQTLKHVDGIYLTRIHADFEGDTFYPEIPSTFQEKSREKIQDEPLIEVIYYEKEVSE